MLIFPQFNKVLAMVVLAGIFCVVAIARPIHSDFKLGMHQIQTQLPGAIASFSKVIHQNPQNLAAYANRCLAYLRSQDYHNAIADCTIALPAVPEALLNRGLAYYQLGQYREAIADYDHLLTNSPDFRAYYNRGLAKSALDQFSAAIADYDLAIAVTDQPHYLGEIYNERGIAQFFLHKVQSALADYSLAITLNPKSDRAYFNRGCAYQQQQNYVFAVQDFSNALKLHPKSPETLINRAIALQKLGKTTEAIADLQVAAQGFLALGAVDDANYAKQMAAEFQNSSQIA